MDTNHEPPPISPSATDELGMATTRPAFVTHGSSDSSVNTLSSFASISTDSSDGISHCDNLMVPITHSPAIQPTTNGGDTFTDLDDGFGSLALDGSKPLVREESSISPIDHDLGQLPAHSTPLLGTVPGPTAWRHRDLPSLITDAERAMQNIRTSAAQTTYIAPSCAIEGSPRSRTMAPVVHTPRATASPPATSPASTQSARYVASTSTPNMTSSAAVSPASSALKRSSLYEQSASAPTTHEAPMSRTSSQSPSFTRLPSPTAIARPGSAGTFSSVNSMSTGSSSSRPWVRDSDASSVCSASSCCSSSSNRKDGEDDPEVFKVEDGFAFLDPRPEPSGVKLAINREDPTVVVVQVTLPGFSLENITVAMRRGNKVHVVADSYDSVNGGHFEKLISLGCDVSSAGPRAEFNGTVLNVFIQRRMARTRSHRRTTSPPMSPPMSSPASSIASPELDGMPSSYFAAAGTVEGHAHGGADHAAQSPPIVTRSTAEFASRNGDTVKSNRCWTGPEGARAAAKAAREEAARRAKEAAKSLTKGYLSAPFRREEKTAVVDDVKTPELAPTPPARNGTIRGRTPSPQPPHASGLVLPDKGEPLNQGKDSLLTRPKLRGSNLTLRAGDRTSFVDAAFAAAAATDSEGFPSFELEDSHTPRVERDSMSFATPAYTR